MSLPAVCINIAAGFRHPTNKLGGKDRTCDAHRHADVSGLKRRRVIHSISRHGARLPDALQRLYNPDLVLGRRAREDVAPRDSGIQLLVAHPVQLWASEADDVLLQHSGGHDPELHGNCHRGGGVVACDHLDLPPGAHISDHDCPMCS
jgi:hypothetical protein